MLHATLSAMVVLILAAGPETPLRKKVSADYRNRTVDEVLKDLGGKAGVTFVCPNQPLEGASPVIYAARDQEAGRIAARILRPRGLRLGQIDGKQVTVEKLDPMDEFKVKREERFEFAEKPMVTRNGDRVTIRFAVKDFCDATVAVEDTQGKIIRCINCRPTLDLFARSFVSEMEHYTVAVLDTNGNLILRVGRYGSVDDGVPLIKAGGPDKPRSLGGDEVALFNPTYLATDTDRRLFIADNGNVRILSVQLGYHTEEEVPLKDVPDKRTAR